MHRAAVAEAGGEEEEPQKDSSFSWLWPFSWHWASSSSGDTTGAAGVESGAAGVDKGAGESQVPTNVRIQGADGPVADIINGDYVASQTKYNGKALFRHENNPNLWLRYVTAGALKQWRVSTSQSLNANNDKGYLYCEEPGLDNPISGKTWYVWMGTRWSLQTSVVLSAFTPPEPVQKKIEDADGGLFGRLKQWLSEHRYTTVVVLIAAWAGVLTYLWRSWKPAVKK